MPVKTLKTRVLIVGGGATGTGIARDLALRGVASILVERGDINTGASGANHGLLHSGSRYAVTDPDTARECYTENLRLKQVAPHCVDDAGGVFVAIAGDDENYIADFPDHCARCGIPVQTADVAELLEAEPALTPRTIAAYRVPDAAIDPFQLSLENIAQSISLGGRLLCHTRLVGFQIRDGRIRSARLEQRHAGKEVTIEVEQVINAAGAWAGQVAALAGIEIPMVYSKGSLVITDQRLTQQVINRLRPATDGDILVPGGTVSLLGTTSIRVDRLTGLRPTVQEIDAIVDQGSQVIPKLGSTRYIRAYAGVRPLLGQSTGDDRGVSRGFELIDHARDNLANLTTITGGKLTTYRLMAEKTADQVCDKLGVGEPCVTRHAPLPSTVFGRWTVPGFAPKRWLRQQRSDDLLLCECEMVPRSAVDQVIAGIRSQGNTPDLKAIGLRSRIGKGACQGAFCGVRILGHLYERQSVAPHDGLRALKRFLNSRWRGLRPVLWDAALVQEELQEAVHCGLFALEMAPGHTPSPVPSPPDDSHER